MFPRKTSATGQNEFIEMELDVFVCRINPEIGGGGDPRCRWVPVMGGGGQMIDRKECVA